ncbi:DUF4189 domain-containing protein [Gordonia sp. CPCC 205333]|uniref:DUF4189 domain-containing protein n=1 Tax=Gordonia sp. CPCC 205333 TaxID=3140790 RepID=UPI003AF37051
MSGQWPGTPGNQPQPGPQFGTNPYGAPHYPTGPQYPGAPHYPSGPQFPGGPGGRPPRPGMSTGVIIAIAAVIVVVVLVIVGAIAVLLTRGHDDDPTPLASGSSTSATTTTTDYSSYSSTETTTTTTTTVAPPTTYFGAIAISRDTGSVGYSINNRSQGAADTAALGQCADNTCEVVSRFYNGCGAVAQSQANLYWGWGWASTRQEAINQAISHVQGAQPKLLTVQCTLNASG